MIDELHYQGSLVSSILQEPGCLLSCQTPLSMFHVVPSSQNHNQLLLQSYIPSHYTVASCKTLHLKLMPSSALVGKFI